MKEIKCLEKFIAEMMQGVVHFTTKLPLAERKTLKTFSCKDIYASNIAIFGIVLEDP